MWPYCMCGILSLVVLALGRRSSLAHFFLFLTRRTRGSTRSCILSSFNMAQAIINPSELMEPACSSYCYQEMETEPTLAGTEMENVEVLDPNLLNYSPELLEFLISRMTFEEVAKFRLVNRDWRLLCDRVLVRGYVQVMESNRKWQAKVHSILPPRLSDYRDHELLPPLRMAEALEEAVLTLNIVYVRGGLKDSFPAGRVLDLARTTQRLIATPTDDHAETIKWLDLTRAAAMKARVHFEKHFPFVPKPKVEPEPKEEVDEFEVAHQEVLANIAKLEAILAAQKPKFDMLYDMLQKAQKVRQTAENCEARINSGLIDS